MNDNNRNFLLAIVLSILVLIGWQVFFGMPKMQEEQLRQQQQAERTTPAPGMPGTAAPPVPGAPAAVPGAPGLAVEAPTPTAQRLVIDTPSLSGSLSTRGARIDDLVLKKYRQTVEPHSPPVVLFSPAGQQMAYYAEHGWAPDPGSDVAVPTAETEWQVVGNTRLTEARPVTLTWDNGEGLVFRRTVAVDQDYMFTVRQEVQNSGTSPVTLHPYALISRHGTPHIEGFFILHEGLIGVMGDKGLQEISYKNVLEARAMPFTEVGGGWLGITDKYWAAVIVPDQRAPFQARFTATQDGGRERYQTDYMLGALTVPAGGSAVVEGHLFAGAKETHIVDGYSERLGIPKFDLLIDWGWFYFLTKPLFFAIDYFFRLVGNFGVAILIVTVIIKLILFPLANKSYVAMSRMKKLQPEMERIKARFENDRARQQQALMEMYRKEKVNPAAGCLPILIQIPVFFALYKVLYVTIEMRHAPFFGWIRDLSAPDPTTIFNLFGLIPWSPPTFLIIGIWPIVMGATMWVQMQLNPAPPDPIQAKIFKWMPLFFVFLLAPFPAGLVIYWAWNNSLSILQQWYIMHRQGVQVALWDNIGIRPPRRTAATSGGGAGGNGSAATGADGATAEGDGAAEEPKPAAAKAGKGRGKPAAKGGAKTTTKARPRRARPARKEPPPAPSAEPPPAEMAEPANDPPAAKMNGQDTEPPPAEPGKRSEPPPPGE